LIDVAPLGAVNHSLNCLNMQYIGIYLENNFCCYRIIQNHLYV